MLALLFVAVAAFYLYRLLGGAPQLRLRRVEQGQVTAQKIQELSEYASRMRTQHKYSAAEKVYLEILKLDHRHATTYSRLGTLYSAQKNYGDAIECFTVAAQLSPSGTTYYNLGLGYYENKNYIKAIAAFEKANMFEPTMQRFVGLGKAFQKVDDVPRMISALEQAAQIGDSAKVLWLLADAYKQGDRPNDAEEVIERIKKDHPKDDRLRAYKQAQRGAKLPV